MAWARMSGGSAAKQKGIFVNGQLQVGMNAYAYKPSTAVQNPTGNNTLYIQNGELFLNNPSGTGSASWMTDLIDLTDINAIVIDISTWDAGNSFYVGLATSVSNNYTITDVKTFYNTGVLSIDTSMITGLRSLAFYTVLTQNRQHRVGINSITYA